MESSPVPHQNGNAAFANGPGVVEEASSAQPISLKQRGTRLSFLGGRRKESKESNGDAAMLSGEGDSHSQPSQSKDSNRRSFFRAQTNDTNSTGATPYSHPQVNGEPTTPDWVQSLSRKSSELVGVVEKANTDRSSESGTPKLGSVRKRFSMLKLGSGSKKSNKSNGTMAGLDEE
jgi:dedicator of cytokinesis protein 3